MARSRRSIAFRFALIGAAVAALVLVWRLLSDRGVESQVVAETERNVVGAASNTQQRTIRAPSSPSRAPATAKAVPQPLVPPPSIKSQPPVGTKVRVVIEQLKEDADSGVPSAACRVGAELTRCWQTRELSRTYEKQLGRASSLPAGSSKARRIESEAAQLRAQAGKDREMCEGVSDELIDQGWRYLLDAALKGNVAAMDQFVVNPPLSQENVISSLEGWTAYRDFGRTFIQRSIESGSVRALYLAFFSAASGMGPGGQALVPRDPYQAIVYGNAALPLVDRAGAEMIMGALPRLQNEAGARAADAILEGNALRGRHFVRNSGISEVSSGLGRPSDQPVTVITMY